MDKPEGGGDLRVHAVGANEQDEALKRLLSRVKIVEREQIPAPPVEQPPVAPEPPIEKAAAAPVEAVEEIIAAEIVIEPHEPPAPTTPPFSLDTEPAWPTPRTNEVFSLDGEVGSPPAPVRALPPAKPRALPPKSAPVAPAAPVAAEEIFSLDVDGPEPTVPVEEVFSLDAADHKSAPVAKGPEPKPAAPKPQSGAFPAVAKPTGSAAVPAPAPRAPAKPLSGTVEEPAKKSAFGSGSSPTLAALSLKGKRPPIKITMVKPGEKSPLAK
jgi:hypothetical protein